MTEPPALRVLRTRLGLSQRELAERLKESVDSIRVWDSGRRPAPSDVLNRANALLTDGNEQLLSLSVLAKQFEVHVRTLRAAARDGRLQATFSNHAFFGRAVALASPSVRDPTSADRSHGGARAERHRGGSAPR